ncbi:hypothetical protein GB937_010173 [Aspergillus fischeri]|nr:hypothetical protein GB937_010173 [Aspergillus fischeri]
MQRTLPLQHSNLSTLMTFQSIQLVISMDIHMLLQQGDAHRLKWSRYHMKLKNGPGNALVFLHVNILAHLFYLVIIHLLMRLSGKKFRNLSVRFKFLSQIFASGMPTGNINITS